MPYAAFSATVAVGKKDTAYTCYADVHRRRRTTNPHCQPLCPNVTYPALAATAAVLQRIAARHDVAIHGLPAYAVAGGKKFPVVLAATFCASAYTTTVHNVPPHARLIRRQPLCLHQHLYPTHGGTLPVATCCHAYRHYRSGGDT